MHTHADKTQGHKSHSVANVVSQKQSSVESTFQFVDNRPEAIAQRKLQKIANDSPQDKQFVPLQAIANNYTSRQQESIQKKENQALPIRSVPLGAFPSRPIHQTVVQRAIGAEVETNLNMYRQTEGGRVPVAFPNGTVIGGIDNAAGHSDVLIDTSKEVEISTAPFNVAGPGNLSSLSLHLAAINDMLQTIATPTRGITLGAAYADLGFELPEQLFGDFHVNVSPHDTDSFEQLYKANTARQNALDAADIPRIKAAHRGIENRNIPDERSQRVLKTAFIDKWRTALQASLLAERRADRFPNTPGEQNLRTLLTRVIGDVAIGLNTRKISGGNSRKNDQELMPKVDIQTVLDQWGASHAGGNVAARVILMQTFRRAMGQARWDFAWHNWRAGIQDNKAGVERDANQIIIQRRPIIRDRRRGNDLTNLWAPETALREENPLAERAATHYLEGVIRPTTSNLVDRGPGAPVGVYEDRRPFVNVASPHVLGNQWEQSMVDYERELQQHRVTYMNGQDPFLPLPERNNGLVRQGAMGVGIALAAYGLYQFGRWVLS